MPRADFALTPDRPAPGVSQRGVDRVSDAGGLALAIGGVLAVIAVVMGATVWLVGSPELHPLLLLAAVQGLGGALIVGMGLRLVLDGRIVTIGDGLVSVRGVRADDGDFDEPVAAYEAVASRADGLQRVIELRHPEPARTVPLLRSTRLDHGAALAAAQRYADAFGKPVFTEGTAGGGGQVLST